jgi:cobalt-zinc-cadmium efflux system membrane fusion protein
VGKAGLVTEPVVVRRLPEHVTAFGNLAFDHNQFAHLAPRAPGVVWRVLKSVGERVQGGDVLALVEAAEVGKTKADLLQAFVQADLREKALQAMKGAAGAVPERSLREGEAALREARIRLLNDQQTLLNLGLAVRLADLAGLSEDQLVRKLRHLGVPPAVVDREGPDTGTANLLPVTAPFAGLIIRGSAVQGENVGPGQPIFSVAATDPLWALLDFRPEDAARLRLGMPVEFQPAGQEGSPAVGALTLISAEADPKTRTVRARAVVRNPDGRFRPNSFGNGRILIRERPEAVIVPFDAVQSDGGEHLVFVRLSATEYQARRIETGISDGKGIEVVKGLQPGEVVVTTGSHALRSEIRRDRIGTED